MSQIADMKKEHEDKVKLIKKKRQQLNDLMKQQQQQQPKKKPKRKPGARLRYTPCIQSTFYCVLIVCRLQWSTSWLILNFLFLSIKAQINPTVSTNLQKSRFHSIDFVLRFLHVLLRSSLVVFYLFDKKLEVLISVVLYCRDGVD